VESRDFDLRVVKNGVLIKDLKYEEIKSDNFFHQKPVIDIELYMGFKDCNKIKIFDGDILLNRITNQERIVKYKKGTFYIGVEPLYSFLLSLENFTNFNSEIDEILPNFEIVNNIHNK